jgi:hypothetical protein
MVETTTNWTGGCLCGAVRYECEGDPASVGLCECTRCQNNSGSIGLIGVVWPKEKVTIKGELSVYEARIHDNLGLWRYFCPTCGSSVSITLDRYPAIRSMMGGTLDDKSRIKPTFAVWHSEGQPWVRLPEEMAVYPDYPEGTFG